MKQKYDNLSKMAEDIRRSTFNAFIEHGEAHLGGSFSMIEGMIAIFECYMKLNDKFILSKAHASFPLCIYLNKKGFNPVLKTHLEIDVANGINCTTGSLGHGLPIAIGMAMARKFLNEEGRIVVMLSDGECQEGTTWESLLLANKFHLDNLLIVVDYNKIQALDYIHNVLPLDNLMQKFKAFNCVCEEVVDGHSFDEIIGVLSKNSPPGAPRAVILNTIKGKGIPEFENDPTWHAKKIREDEKIIGYKALGII